MVVVVIGWKFADVPTIVPTPTHQILCTWNRGGYYFPDTLGGQVGVLKRHIYIMYQLTLTSIT